MSAESPVWCSRKRKIIPMRMSKRSGPDRSLLFRATACYFAAALHSSKFFWFMWVDDRMMWQVPLKLTSGFVLFNLKIFRTELALTSLSMVS